MASEFIESRETLAEALLELADRDYVTHRLVLAASSSSLSARIKRLMGVQSGALPQSRRYRWVLTLGAIIAVVWVAGILWRRPRVYRATSRLQIERQHPDGLDVSPFGPLVDPFWLRSQLALIKSERVFGDVIDQMGLQIGRAHV